MKKPKRLTAKKRQAQANRIAKAERYRVKRKRLQAGKRARGVHRARTTGQMVDQLTTAALSQVLGNFVTRRLRGVADFGRRFLANQRKGRSR